MSLRSSWVALLFASLLFVGCGKDEPAEQSNGQPTSDDAQIQPKDGDDGDDLATDKREKQDPVSENDETSSFDVTYITEDFVAAVSIRPSAIVGSRLVTDLHKLLIAQFGEKFYEEDRNSRRIYSQVEGFQQAFGINPFQIEEILVLIDKQTVAAGGSLFGSEEEFDEGVESLDGDDASPCDDEPNLEEGNEGAGTPPLPSAIIRLGQKVDREQLLNPFRRKVRNFGELIEKQHAGHSYLVSSKIGIAAHSPDDETVVIAPEETLKKMLTAKNVDSPLTRQLKTAGRHQLVAAVDVAALEDTIASLRETNVGFMLGFLQVFATQAWTVTVDLDGEFLLTGKSLASSEDAAAAFFKMEQAQWNTNKQQWPVMKTLIPPTAQGLVPIVDSLIEGVSLKQDGVSVKVTVKMPQGLDKLPKLLKPLIAEAQASAKQASKRSNLKQIMIAMHYHHDTYAVLPAADGLGLSTGNRKSGLLSWRVYLLPYLDHASLYQKFNLDEAWDSEHNKPLIKQMPNIFGDDPDGKTSVHVFTGECTPFGGKTGAKFRDITDGQSNVIGVV